MNFKDRGITIGDLLIISIIIISMTFIINKSKNSGKQSYLYITPNEINNTNIITSAKKEIQFPYH